MVTLNDIGCVLFLLFVYLVVLDRYVVFLHIKESVLLVSFQKFLWLRFWSFLEVSEFNFWILWILHYSLLFSTLADCGFRLPGPSLSAFGLLDAFPPTWVIGCILIFTSLRELCSQRPCWGLSFGPFSVVISSPVTVLDYCLLWSALPVIYSTNKNTSG